MAKNKPLDPRMIAIGQRLRERREFRGWERGEIAKALGITEGRYIDWELGRYLMPAVFVLDIAKVFGIPVGYFLGEDPQVTLDWLKEEPYRKDILAKVRRKPLQKPENEE